MAGTRIVSNQPASKRCATEESTSSPNRWYGAFDAMAPYLVLIVAVAIARHSFTSSVPTTFVVVVTAITLAVGAGAMFFRDMSDSHLTWPIAFALFVLLAPFLTLHASFEHSALDAPVPVHLLPLVFTWAGTFIVASLIASYLYTLSASDSGWAGLNVAPIAVLVASVAATSFRLSRDATLAALLTAFAIAAIATGIGWLMPERYRWFLIPVVLTTGAVTTLRAVLMTPHHLPGRWLFLGDGALATAIGLIALASPFLCRWLTSQRAMRAER